MTDPTCVCVRCVEIRNAAIVWLDAVYETITPDSPADKLAKAIGYNYKKRGNEKCGNDVRNATKH